jgi:hypothetical protein
MMPSGVRNSRDTIATKLLRNWLNSFSLATVLSNSVSARLSIEFGKGLICFFRCPTAKRHRATLNFQSPGPSLGYAAVDTHHCHLAGDERGNERLPGRDMSHERSVRWRALTYMPARMLKLAGLSI